LKPAVVFSPEFTRHSTTLTTKVHSQIQTCWDLVYERSDFQNRLKTVQDFNAGSRYRKRGLALIPTKFGISFTAKFLNQVTLSPAAKKPSCSPQ